MVGQPAKAEAKTSANRHRAHRLVQYRLGAHSTERPRVEVHYNVVGAFTPPLPTLLLHPTLIPHRPHHPHRPRRSHRPSTTGLTLCMPQRAGGGAGATRPRVRHTPLLALRRRN